MRQDPDRRLIRVGRIVALSLTLLASAARAAPPPVVLQTDVDLAPCRRQARQAVDAAVTLSRALYGSTDPVTGPPLTVVLHRTMAAYRAAESRLTGGRFRHHNAFSHAASGTAHVALVPPCSDATLRALGLPRLTLRMLAHETAHLVGFRDRPASARWPDWLAEGAATWVQERVARQAGWRGEGDADPYAATFVAVLQQLQAKEGLPRLSEVLGDTLPRLTPTQRYGLQYHTFAWLLARRPEAVRALLASPRPELAGARLLRELVGLDAEFARHLAARTPAWVELYRSLTVSGDELHQHAFERLNAVAWRTRPVARRRYRIRGAVCLLPGRSHQLNVLLGRATAGFYSVALADGVVSVFRFDRAAQRWISLVGEPCERLRIGYRARFEVHVAGDRLVVRIDGQIAARTRLEAEPPTGPWGLGAQAGSAGIWRGVELVAD